MGTHFRFGTRTTCGVDGQRQLHEGVPAIPEGVVFTGLNPRELERSRDRQTGNSRDQDCRQDRPARARPKLNSVKTTCQHFQNTGNTRRCVNRSRCPQSLTVASSPRSGSWSWGDVRVPPKITCVTGLFYNLSPVDSVCGRRDRGTSLG